MKKLKTILFAGISLLSVSSCSFFDAKPEDSMQSDENFEEKTAIYSNFIGLLANLQDVVDQLVFVTELRGDLMMPTDQAPDEYWDVFKYNVENAEANPLYDPAPFYKIVMNCNDFLRNTVKYNSDYPGVLATNIYRQMIAGAVCLRTWAYLTLGKLYGGAVYYDYAFTNEVDLGKMQDKWLDLKDLVPQLLYFMMTGVDSINGIMLVKLDEMFGLSGNQWRRMSIAPDVLLTELFLWNGNYEMAAKRGIGLISDKGVFGGGDENRWSLNSYFQKTNWPSMFSTGFGGSHENEGISVVFWNTNEGQDNNLMNYFGNKYSNDKYYLKATPWYTDMFYYGKSTVEPRFALSAQSGRAAIAKFDQEFNEKYFYIYRAGELYLLIAEALNGLGDFEAADSLINYGTKLSQSGGAHLYPFDAPIYWHKKFQNCNGIRGRIGNGYSSGGNSVMPRITSAQFMSNRLKELHRKSDDGTQYVYQEIKAVGPNHPRWNDYLEYTSRRRFIIDSLISLETGRELGFEAKRFFTLVRMATQLDNPEILAQQLSKKYEDEDEQFEAAQILRNKENWFIKYDLKMINAKQGSSN